MSLQSSTGKIGFLFLLFAFLLPQLSNAYSGPSKRFLVFHLDPQYKHQVAKGYGYMMELDPSGLVKILARYPITYGKRGTNKRRENDQKTPIGIYKITKKVNTPKSGYKKFGGRNISLNYPNRHDKAARRTGHSIAIHGGRTNPTLGCVRVLDGSIVAPSFGKRNIRHMSNMVPTGSSVIIAEDINKSLINEPGNYLDPIASEFWINLLKKDLGKGSMIQEFLAFNQLPSPNSIASSKANSWALSSGPARPLSTTIKKNNLSVTASSTYGKKSLYGTKNLLDDEAASAWIPEPIDKEKQLTYAYDFARNIQKFSIKVGYDKFFVNGKHKFDLWGQNARPSVIQLTFDDGSKEKIQLRDTRNSVEYTLSKVYKSKTIQVQVIEFIPGKKFKENICISELKFK